MQPIIIKYSGGKINIEIKKFNQEIHLSKNQKLYSNLCIVNNTCWKDDIHQTIKQGETNYYLMSKNEFVNLEEPIFTTDNKNTLIIQIVNVKTNTKNKKTIEKSQADKLVKTKDKITVEF